eukprot:3933558-Rhodomonas_salina.1
MQKLLLLAFLALLCCSGAHAENNIKNMEDRIAKKHDDENSQLRDATTLAAATNAATLIIPVDIVSVMLNRPILCCVLDVRVRVHLERILVAALEAYEDGELARAVKLLRLFIQRVQDLECELDPCMERAVGHVMEIIRYLATSNTVEGMEGMITSGDELRADGLLEAASVTYARALQTEMVSMGLAAEQAIFPKPSTLELSPSAVLQLPLPVKPLPVFESTPERPEKEDEKPPPTHDDPEGDGAAIDEEEAFILDGKLVAESFGWSEEDSMRHMTNQRRFGVLMTTIDEKYSQVLAGSAMARNPGDAATVWFKGEAPDEVAAMLKPFMEETGMRVQVVDKMKFSMREQEDRMDRLAMLLGERGYKGVGATMLPGDIIHLTLPASDDCPEVKVDPTDDDSEVQIPHPEEVDPVARKLLPESLDWYGVKITCTSEEIDVDLHARGGRKVSGGGYQCTAGFSVYRISDGVNGISTAAHCTGMSTFDAEAPEADFALFHRGEHCGSHGDVEWKTTNHVELAEYWANVNDRRNVNSVESWYSNNNVYCVFSRMQGRRTCDRVYSHSTNQYGCWGVTAKRLVAMDHNRVIGGDSGGPWSYSTEAAGVTKGYKTIWFKKRDTFTKATRFDEALGVRIKTK